jgi:hypothetical protein
VKGLLDGGTGQRPGAVWSRGRTTVIRDKADERVMTEAAAKAATVPGTAPIQPYKNNTTTRVPPTARTRTI